MKIINNIVDTKHIKNFITESGILSDNKIKKAEHTMFEKNIDFVDALVENNFLDQQALSEIYASIMGVPKVNLSEKIITLELFKNIPEIIANNHNLVCFAKSDTEISVAFVQIQDLEILEKYIPEHLELKLFLADRAEIREKNRKYTELNHRETAFKNQHNIKKITKMDTFGVRSEADLPRHFRNDIANDLYTEKFVTGILEHAVRAQADFIFFNISDDYDIEISLRAHDRNYTIMSIGYGVMFSIGSSIKAKADIDIFEKFIVKQGSFEINIAQQKYIIFTTFVQTDFGETVTLQITKNKKFKTDLSKLSQKQRNMLLSAQKKDSGFFLLSGGKDSGKSTTLYNFLEFDVAKHKDIYSLEHSVKHNLSYTKQISLDEKTNILPIVSKIMKNHPDVLAVEKVTAAMLPMLFNYVSTSKKVFLSQTKELGKFIDLLVEMNFDKGQIVKNFSLFIEHVTFKSLQDSRTLPVEYFLNKDEVKTIHSFITKSEISALFLEEGLEKESKKSLAKLTFFTKVKTGKKSRFFASASSEKNTPASSGTLYIRGIIDLGLFLENSFLKRYNKEKIKNSLRKEVKKAILQNALLASHRQQIDIKEVLKYLTK